jgi:hypothetical protein
LDRQGSGDSGWIRPRQWGQPAVVTRVSVRRPVD